VLEQLKALDDAAKARPFLEDSFGSEQVSDE
jgi:hypothetical protein